MDRVHRDQLPGQEHGYRDGRNQPASGADERTGGDERTTPFAAGGHHDRRGGARAQAHRRPGEEPSREQQHVDRCADDLQEVADDRREESER